VGDEEERKEIRYTQLSGGENHFVRVVNLGKGDLARKIRSNLKTDQGEYIRTLEKTRVGGGGGKGEKSLYRRMPKLEEYIWGGPRR